MKTKTSKGKEIRIPGPDHPITIWPADGRVRVTVAGSIVADGRFCWRSKDIPLFTKVIVPTTAFP